MFVHVQRCRVRFQHGVMMSDGVGYRSLFPRNAVARQRDINPARMYVDNN